jgi:CheY-like chemotaxis protein
MNGTIELKSEIQKGSSFILNLYDIDVGSLIENKQTIEIPEVKFDKATILVVDDVLANRKLVTATLNNDSFSFLEAKNGKEAVNIVNNKSNKIDLILMDLRMPIMNGYEATAKIKELNKNIPIVAFTASVMNKELEQIKEYEFDGYIRKPVIYDKLIQELMKHLSYEELKIQEDTSIDTILSNNNIKNIPYVLEKLENEYKITLDKIKDKGDFSLIEELMNEIDKLAKEKELSILENYTTNILLAIESFDIDKVTYMINNYSSICNKLKTLYKEQ